MPLSFSTPDAAAKYPSPMITSRGAQRVRDFGNTSKMGGGTKLVTFCVIAGACAILNGYRHTSRRRQERRMDDADDELSNLVKSYEKDGYVVLPGLLDPVEIRSLGDLVNTEIARGTLGPRVGATSGYYTSDASRHPGLKQIDTYLYSNPEHYSLLHQLILL